LTAPRERRVSSLQTTRYQAGFSLHIPFTKTISANFPDIHLPLHSAHRMLRTKHNSGGDCHFALVAVAFGFVAAPQAKAEVILLATLSPWAGILRPAGRAWGSGDSEDSAAISKCRESPRRLFSPNC
jgi:hypothetical protein